MYTNSYTKASIISEWGDIGLFVKLLPKIFNPVFLFVNLTTLGTFINFDWLVHVSAQTFQPLVVIYRRDNFMYPFIDLCFISLGP